MTDNPSGSTGQNVTTPANAPAGSDSSERDALAAKLNGCEDTLYHAIARAEAAEAKLVEEKADAWKTTQVLYESTQTLGRTIEQRDAAVARAAALASALTKIRELSDHVSCDSKFSQECRACGLLDIVNDALAGNGNGTGEDGWIACRERMPDTAAADTGEFIVLLNGEEVTHGWLRDGAWLVLDAECFDPVEMVPPMVLNSVVTHWRPLPAAPPSAGETRTT